MKITGKKIIALFTVAFLINWIWEILHSKLYIHYQNGEITNFILFQAAVLDGLIILLIVLVALRIKINPGKFVLLAGLITAIFIEIWPAQTGRWAYNDPMPIIPFLKVGLTPVIQLSLTDYLAQRLTL